MALKGTKFNPTSHTHDDRYYTESEMDTKLSGKANASHTHSKSQITDFPASLKNPTSISIKLNGGTATTYDGSTAKSINITPSSIGAAASNHTHGQYYDSSQSRSANTVLAAPNGSDGGASFRKLVASDIPSLSYLPLTGGTVSGLTTFTDNLNVNKSVVTYGIEVYHTKTPFIDFHYENDGTVDYTSRIIENAKGILNINGATFSTGGSVWCPTLKVDNAINGNLNGCAKTLALGGDLNYPATFNWTGQNGQPNWVWGGSDMTNMYVYNPSNFNVNSATYLSVKGTNTYQGSDDNTGNWGKQGCSLHWYSGAYMKNQPSGYMYVMNLTLGGAEVHQIGCAQPGGSLYHRGGNSAGWNPTDGSWATIVDTSNSVSTLGIQYWASTKVLSLANDTLRISVNPRNNAPSIYSTNNTMLSFIAGNDWHALTPDQYFDTSLGTGQNKFKNLYISGTVSNGSDEKLKDIIDTGIDERYEKFFLKLNPILYKWKNFEDHIALGNRRHDRIHCGLGARETEKHAIECGLDSISVALICKDKLDTPKEDGTDDIYALAYSELHGLEIHMIQKLYKEKEELENRIDKLEKVIEELQNK